MPYFANELHICRAQQKNLQRRGGDTVQQMSCNRVVYALVAFLNGTFYVLITDRYFWTQWSGAGSLNSF